MKKGTESAEITSVGMGKDKLLDMVEGMLMFFKDPDEESVEESSFGKYLNMWTGSYTICIPFLERHKAVTIRKSSVDGDALKGASNIATLYKDKIIKLKEYLEEYPKKYVPISERKIYGDKENRRSYMTQ